MKISFTFFSVLDWLEPGFLDLPNFSDFSRYGNFVDWEGAGDGGGRYASECGDIFNENYFSSEVTFILIFINDLYLDGGQALLTLSGHIRFVNNDERQISAFFVVPEI